MEPQALTQVGGPFFYHSTRKKNTIVLSSYFEEREIKFMEGEWGGLGIVGLGGVGGGGGLS